VTRDAGSSVGRPERGMPGLVNGCADKWAQKFGQSKPDTAYRECRELSPLVLFHVLSAIPSFVFHPKTFHETRISLIIININARLIDTNKKIRKKNRKKNNTYT